MMMPVFADAAARVISREVNAISRKQQLNAQWLDDFYQLHQG